MDTTALLTQLLAPLTASSSTSPVQDTKPFSSSHQSFQYLNGQHHQHQSSPFLSSDLQANSYLLQALLIKELLSGHQYNLERALPSIGGNSILPLSRLLQTESALKPTINPIASHPGGALMSTTSRDNDFLRKPEKKKDPSCKHGTWSEQEHTLFLKGLEEFGAGRWKDISSMIPSRTPDQTRSHAQKYFKKLANSKKNVKGTKRHREEGENPKLKEEEPNKDSTPSKDAALAPKKTKVEPASSTTAGVLVKLEGCP